MPNNPLTILDIRKLKEQGKKIVMCTAYDATFARILDQAGIEILLVGDSLGMVVQGHPDTIGVTVEQIAYHTAAVTRGAQRAHIVADMPFMSYRISTEKAIEAAAELMQKGRAHAIKLEGGIDIAHTVKCIVAAGIPVMGHIGLTPQSVHAMGGFKVQGRDTESARNILNDALAIQKAGAYAIVLEAIPCELAQQITKRLTIPTIGIGAGVGCDGQVLVSYDLLGMNPDFKPKFVKHYVSLHEHIRDAAQHYANEVRNETFPTQQHSFRSQNLRLLDTPANPPETEKLYSTVG